MNEIIAELNNVAKELMPCAIITVPRKDGVDNWAYNEVHFELSKLLDRIRRNEGLVTFIERNDADDSMVLKIGFTDHEAGEAIVRELVSKASKICSKNGIDKIQASVEENLSLLDESIRIRRIASEIKAEERQNERILDALMEMGAVPNGYIAGPIRWQAVFFVGPAGSGKSRIRNMRYMRHLDFKVVDPDEIKTMHPDYDPSKPFKTHAWSKEVADSEFKKIVESGNGDPVVVDGTGRNAEGILKKMELAKRNGYRTYVVYVYVPFEVSIFRNRNRSRFVPEEVIVEQSAKIKKNYARLKSKADKAKVVLNYERSELKQAQEDIKLYPVPQSQRPPRPGDSDYGMARAAGDILRVARLLMGV